MPKPDPYEEARLIRTDIGRMIASATNTADLERLRSLQTAIVRWIQRNTPHDAPQAP